LISGSDYSLAMEWLYFVNPGGRSQNFYNYHWPHHIYWLCKKFPIFLSRHRAPNQSLQRMRQVPTILSYNWRSLTAPTFEMS
jgi:hypothetical protein